MTDLHKFLDCLKTWDLQQICRESGIRGYSRLKKQALVKLIILHKTQITALSLRYNKNKFDRFPEEIFEFPALTTLDLSSNEIVTIPESIGQLTALTTLELSSNKITTIPESIGQLTALTSINLRYNKITMLPESFFSLIPRLSLLMMGRSYKNQIVRSPDGAIIELDLSNVGLETLPESIANLSKLQKLDLSENILTTLPVSFFGLVSQLSVLLLGKSSDNRIVHSSNGALIKLDLSGVGLKSLHENIGRFSKLITLDLSNNHLATIPDSIGYLPELTTLHIHYERRSHFPNILGFNRLTSLPKSFFPLVHRLSKLTLNHTVENQMKFSPDGRLIELGLQRLALNNLPENIACLSELEKLDLSFNHLAQLPETIGQLTKLTALNLYGNRLTTLPKSIGRLLALTFLNLSGNQLITLPESIGKLQALTLLHLYINKITMLPESIGKLSALATLTLSYNKLTALPESIGNLQELKYFRFDHNNIARLPASLAKLSSNEELYQEEHFTWNDNNLPYLLNNMSKKKLFRGIQTDIWSLAKSLIKDGKLSQVDEMWLIQLCGYETLVYLESQLGPNHPILREIRVLRNVTTEFGSIIL